MKIYQSVCVVSILLSLSACSSSGVTNTFREQAESVQASNIALCNGSGVKNYMEIWGSDQVMVACKDGSSFWLKK